jgi:hypothetical protein
MVVGLSLQPHTRTGSEARSICVNKVPRLPVAWCGFYFAYRFTNRVRALLARPQATP